MLGPYRKGEEMKRIESVILTGEEIAAIISGQVPPVSAIFDEILSAFPNAGASFTKVSDNHWKIEISAESTILPRDNSINKGME